MIRDWSIVNKFFFENTAPQLVVETSDLAAAETMLTLTEELGQCHCIFFSLKIEL